MKSSSSAGPPGKGGRWRYLNRLWQAALAQPELPQFDRWFAREIKQYKQFGKQDRYWYSEMLFAALRFGYLATYLNFLHSKTGVFRGSPGPPRLSGKMFRQSLADFEQAFPGPASVLDDWRKMTAGEFFEWVHWRYAAEDGPEPSPAANRPGAAAEISRGQVFSTLKSQVEGDFSRGANLPGQMLWYGIPLWFKDSMEERIRRSGWNRDETERFIRNHGQRPPLWLRINHPSRTAEVIRELKSSGFTVEGQGAALQVRGSKGIYELAAYKNGYVEVQDLASQRIGEKVSALPGQMAWDCCAGGGGKTLQIAARPGGERGAVYASDIREFKLEELRRRVRKAQFHNVRTVVWEGETLPDFGKEVQNRGGFHWVLVDAPCSASGTWRRNPDGKWRFNLSGLPALTALQYQLLQNASLAVRPQGRLVYATCSWLAEENEFIVERFLKENPAFRLVEQELVGSPRENADTMFAATLARVS